MLCNSIAVGLLALLVMSTALSAGVTWTSQNRYVQTGYYWEVTPFGASQGNSSFYDLTTTSALNFGLFSVGHLQTSSIGPATIDLEGTVQVPGAPIIGIQYHRYPVEFSYLQVIFALDAPTDFTLSADPLPFGESPGIHRANPAFFGPGGFVTASSGTLAPGNYSFTINVSAGYPDVATWHSFANQLTLEIPEPAAIGLLSAAMLIVARRRLPVSCSPIYARSAETTCRRRAARCSARHQP